MTTPYATIAAAHSRITVLEQANAVLQEECEVWWEALARAVHKNQALQTEIARLTAAPVPDVVLEPGEVWRPKQPKPINRT